MDKEKDSDVCVKKCQSLCCTGVSIPIDTPRTTKDEEELRFYVLHKNVEVYIRSNRWYILINEKCENLGKDYMCKDYERRPLICRRFSNKECEYWGEFYDIRFKKEADLVEYLEGRKKRKKRK